MKNVGHSGQMLGNTLKQWRTRSWSFCWLQMKNWKCLNLKIILWHPWQSSDICNKNKNTTVVARTPKKSIEHLNILKFLILVTLNVNQSELRLRCYIIVVQHEFWKEKYQQQLLCWKGGWVEHASYKQNRAFLVRFVETSYLCKDVTLMDSKISYKNARINLLTVWHCLWARLLLTVEWTQRKIILWINLFS